MESTKTLTIGTAEKTKSVTLAEATSNISQTVSSDCVKIHEAMEFCSKAEMKSKELKAETKQLSIDKNESLQIRDELISRNKANAANWENWVQTRYELDKLKCDLKAEVMMIDIAAQAKRAKYIKTVTSFRRHWEETENQYKNFPEVKEFNRLRKLNESLSEEIKKRNNLLQCTMCEYSELLKAHKESLQGKLIEFARESLALARLSQIDQEKKEKEEMIKNLKEELQRLQKTQNQKKDDSAIYFKPSISHFDIRRAFNQSVGNTKNYLAVDITAFDKISIPIENLETSTDEDLFSYSKYKNINCEMDSSVQSDALSDNNSEGGDSQVISPSENVQASAQNQQSGHFQTQGQNPHHLQINNEAAASNQTSQYWMQKESEAEKIVPKNQEVKTVRFATKRASQELVEEPQAKLQDLRDEGFEQTEEHNENNEDHSYEAPEVDDQSFEFDDTNDNYSNKSYGSFEGDPSSEMRSATPENSFLNTENHTNAPKVLPPSPPPIRPALDSNPLQNILPIRSETPTPAQPFSFTFNSSTPAKSSIFNLF